MSFEIISSLLKSAPQKNESIGYNVLCILLYSLDSIKIIPHVFIIYFKWHHFFKN